MYICVYAYVYMCVYTYAYTNVYMYIYTYTRIYIYTHIYVYGECDIVMRFPKNNKQHNVSEVLKREVTKNFFLFESNHDPN